MSPVPITGSVLAAGDAAGGAEVVLFGLAGERPVLLAAAETRADGTFALAPPEPVDGPIAVLARLRGDAIGVAAVELPGPPQGPVTLDVPGPGWDVTVAVERGEGDPEDLTIALEPDVPETVPARLRPFINQRAPGVFAGSFVTRELVGDALTLRVMPGRWRITGRFIDLNRPNITDPDTRNVVVTGARSEPDGAPLPGTETGGFLFDVDRDRRVTLVLREVPDAEL